MSEVPIVCRLHPSPRCLSAPGAGGDFSDRDLALRATESGNLSLGIDLWPIPVPEGELRRASSQRPMNWSDTLVFARVVNGQPRR